MSVVLGAAELLADSHAELGECPVALETEGALLWIDMPAGTIFRTSISTGATTRHKIASRIGSIALREQSTFVAATGAVVCTLEHLDAAPTVVAESFIAEGCRLNDGRVDPWGSFVVGSACQGRAARDGGLYRIGPDGSVLTLLRGLGMANGVDWNPAADLMYFVDTVTQSVMRYAVANEGRTVLEPSLLVAIPRDLGLPDGLTVDQEGCVWLALWGAGQVRRFAPDGRHIGTVRVPARLVTSCCFADDLQSLFITTAKEPVNATTSTHPGGALFVYRTSCTGQAPRMFHRP